MKIPQSSTRTRRLRARAKKHQIFFSEKKKKKNTREERFKRFFLSRTTREDEKEEKQRDKERFFKPYRKRREPLLFFFCYSCSYPSCYYCCCICRCSRVLVCCLQPRLRFAGIGARLSSSLFFIYSFFLCIISLLLLFGGQKFLSFSLSLSPKRQTDRHTLCDHSSEREIHDEREVKVLRALLFSFLSSQKDMESFVTLLLARKK